MNMLARGALLLVAAGSVWLNWRFAFTDAAWEMMGRPPETYPEFVFLFLGLPLAIGALAGAAALAWTYCRRRAAGSVTQVLWGLTLICIAGSLWWAAQPYMAPPERPTSAGPWENLVSSLLFFGCPTLMLTQIVLAVAVVSIHGRSR